MTPTQAKVLNQLRECAVWVTGWEIGRQERTLNALVEMGLVDRDFDCTGLGRTVVSYRIKLEEEL